MMLSPADRDRYLTAALAAARRAGEIHRGFYRGAELGLELKADGSPVTRSDRLAEEAIREVLRLRTPELGLLGEELPAEGDARDRWVIDPLDGTKGFVAGLPFFGVLIALELDGAQVLGLAHAPLLGAPPSSAPRSLDGDPAAGETWWAARGHGAWGGSGTTADRAGDRRLAVSTTARLADAFFCHGGLKRFQEQGLWEGLSTLVARTRRSRGFGDFWGHMLVAEGRSDAMVEASLALHDVAPLKVIVEEAGGRLLTRDATPLTTDLNAAVLSANATLAEEIAALLGF